YLALKYVPAARFWEQKAPPTAAEEIFGSLNITSDPEGARIFLDGTDTGTVTPTVIDKLPSGRIYTVRAEKDDYGPAERSIQISGPQRLDVALALSPPMGTLNIITEPPGAAIMVDGKLTGLNSPATIEKLKLGSDLRITLSKPDYEDFEQVVNLTSPKPQKISTKLTPIIPQLGKLVINSTPAGAKVIVDGKDTGRTTPAMIANLGPKKYAVALRMEGYDDWTGNFDVNTNMSVPVEAQLKKSGAAEVPQAQVPPVEAAKGPEQPPTTSVPATPGEVPTEAQKPPAELPKPPVEEAKTASLKISSTPPGARITLDGAQTGRNTPATIDKLKVGGSYKIKLDMDGYQSASRRSTLAKESNAIAMALTKVEAPTEQAIIPPAKGPPQPPAEITPPPKVESGKPGMIKVSSNPSGADVFINSELKGKTPLTASVPPGTAQVVVNLEGRARVSRSVTVKPGETVNLSNIELGDLYGDISLSSDPPAAQVIIDGQAIPARTPVTVRKVRRDRPHTVTIQLPGYKPWSTTFTLDQSSKSFHATLQPQ
ncbi:MAG: PEGA domain-containing protein, partial [bacterium]